MSPTPQELFARDAAHYFQMNLLAPERILLDQIGVRWGSVAMLDIGVGAGRTTYTFGAICRRYVGIDYVPRMIELSRARVGETERCRLEIGDARDLSRFGDAEFDVVLISFNGIDALEHDDRIRVLRESRRVLRPGGAFLFSSHSLNVFPFRFSLPAVSWRRPLRVMRFFGGAVRRWVRLRIANGSINPSAVRKRGWSMIVDDGHDFQMAFYYVSPGEQVGQLRDAGFTVNRILGLDGGTVTDPSVSQEHWLHYLCTADSGENELKA